ncbi:hypothetical protein [Ornithinibacillus halotolerans]|uniref:Uncharacterized protein n=1 Tax=Ornithinibacillus halotolerans TaxID=1274357 RepID=A0A916RK44_9BACI|nr:hypothetical protein [Ornithinibacillus halotolerans]GGA60339.1 hypothetical protein GCM10008025_00440 [Ornithinibacillus halotolerans]
MKNSKRLSLSIAIIVTIFILTVGVVLINQIHKNHQANQLIIEKCFENFDELTEVTVTKDGLWSPVKCEKKE